MKGLVIKDLYMTAKYCRSYLLIVIGFCAVSFFSRENLFFIFYPAVLCGMIPVNIIAYDERSRWTEYSRALPYTEAQIVSGKYLIGLMSQGAVLAVTGVSQLIQMNAEGDLQLGGFLTLMALLLSLSLFSPSVCLPFIFRYGVEKGRLAYYVVVGVVCGLTIIFSKAFASIENIALNVGKLMPVICVFCIGLYALSWVISVIRYKRREI